MIPTILKFKESEDLEKVKRFSRDIGMRTNIYLLDPLEYIFEGTPNMLLQLGWFIADEDLDAKPIYPESYSILSKSENSN